MTSSDSIRGVRRALTRAEIDGVLADITAAENTGDLIHRAVRAVFTTLLAGTGRTIDEFGPSQRLNPSDYAIPASQWQAIMRAITDRAAEWGASVTLALDLTFVMPSTYEDPQVPAPVVARVDRRPGIHDLHVTREATDVIAACDAHVQALGAYFGPTSPQYLDAFTSWHHQLARLFSMAMGADTRISADGPRSLFVSTASGFVFGIIFHGARRHCTTAGCTAIVGDDGTAYPPYPHAPLLDHEHEHSYPLDAPQPGSWSFHS